ncbi:M1 family metallopeptidase [Nocardia sp. CDC159]|uniref:Aminopeptidase N n=1 Tax=Nocardia pulmonis TaxID=2951408 RepID=A0A9X2E475_9NOCA|nr:MULTISPECIES: M1 family metallopeptidase [Nocardia]MCM6772515.1 M1 family metallopeptidase [Nocardia pulmonis]MCM6784827.1 M1 family metallopeptidase [Nocardia sp. CDC159]
MGMQRSSARRRWRAVTAPAVFLVLALAAGAPVAAAPAPPGAPAPPTPGSDGLGDPYYPKDGNGGYDALHYDVAIDYDPPSRRLTGKTTITAKATQDLSAFNLDFAGPPVKAVTVNGVTARFARQGEHELVVTPAAALPLNQQFTVVVDYQGTAQNTQGNGWTISPSGGAFAAGEPHSATTWYPLNDTPLDKVTFTVRATVPTGWGVVSNGIQTSDTPAGSGKHTVVWEHKNPIIGYLTTIGIDKFKPLTQRRSDGTPLLSYFAPGAENKQSLERRLPQVLDVVEQVYGKYPFESGGGLYVSTNLNFALETQTRPIYAPWVDLNTVVHEQGHQWWGNAVSIKQWKDICINECFASYTADFLWPEKAGNQNPDQIYRNALAAADRANVWRTPLYDPGRGNEFTVVYTRGPLFLHALRRYVGDNVFYPALKDFLAKYKYANASIPDFREFVQSRTTKNLTGFFNAWLNGRQRPADEYLFPGSLSAGPRSMQEEQLPGEWANWPLGQGDRKGRR